MTSNPPPYPAPQYGAPPYPPGGPGGKQRLRGRTPLRLSIIFFVVAVVLFVVGGIVLAKKSFDKVDGFQRVSISSGSGTVSLNGTGKWIGYYEADDVDSGIDRIPDFRVAITGPNGQPVSFKAYGNRSDGKVDKLTYSHDGHKGAAALQFTAPSKGTYRVRLQAVDTLPSGADLAFGRDIKKGTAVGAALIGIGVLLIIAAIVLLIVGLVKRGRHKNQLAGAGGYGGPPPNYPPPGGYGGPPPNYPPPGGYGGQQYPPQNQPPQQYPDQGWGPPPSGGPSLQKE